MEKKSGWWNSLKFFVILLNFIFRIIFATQVSSLPLKLLNPVCLIPSVPPTGSASFQKQEDSRKISKNGGY